MKKAVRPRARKVKTNKSQQIRDYIKQYPKTDASTIAEELGVNKQLVYQVRGQLKKKNNGGGKSGGSDLAKDIADIRRIGIDRARKILELMEE